MTDVREISSYLGVPDIREQAAWEPGQKNMAADRGEVEPERSPTLMRVYLGPSLDTTIFATANLVLLFGR